MTSNSATTASPIAAQSVFSRPAALIGGAIGLVALTAIATTMAVRTPASSDSSGPAPSSATLMAQAQPQTSATAKSSTPPQAPADFPEKTAPVAAATAKPLHTQRGSVQPAPSPQRSASTCATCGKVESVAAVVQKGEGTGLGVVGGAVVGGLLGSQVGGGSGKNVATVLGAVGGGVAGNEVEKRSRATTVYRVSVRMDDGTLRSVTQSTAPAVGQKVTVEGSTLRARPTTS